MTGRGQTEPSKANDAIPQEEETMNRLKNKVARLGREAG